MPGCYDRALLSDIIKIAQEKAPDCWLAGKALDKKNCQLMHQVYGLIFTQPKNADMKRLLERPDFKELYARKLENVKRGFAFQAGKKDS